MVLFLNNSQLININIIKKVPMIMVKTKEDDDLKILFLYFTVKFIAKKS